MIKKMDGGEFIAQVLEKVLFLCDYLFYL